MNAISRIFIVAACVLAHVPLFAQIPDTSENLRIRQFAQADIVCPKCKKTNPPDAKYCSYCATRLPKAPPPPLPEPHPAPPPPPMPPPMPPPLPPPPAPEPMPHAKTQEAWTLIGNASAEGDATEFRVDRHATTCRIFCREGRLIINTLVVRRGADKKPIPVRANLKQGESVEIQINGPAHVTGFRISHEGRGIFEVYVK